MLDSDSWSFEVVYGNEEHIRAGGYHRKPDGFLDGMHEIFSLFSGEIQQTQQRAKAILERIEQADQAYEEAEIS